MGYMIEDSVKKELTAKELASINQRANEFDQLIRDQLLNKHMQPWYRRLFPFLPIMYTNESLRLFVFQLIDCSVSAHSLTKTHAFDLLEFNHRKWWQPKYIGFQIWY